MPKSKINSRPYNKNQKTIAKYGTYGDKISNQSGKAAQARREGRKKTDEMQAQKLKKEAAKKKTQAARTAEAKRVGDQKGRRTSQLMGVSKQRREIAMEKAKKRAAQKKKK